jgi:glycosyltransferase family protein
MVKFSLSLFFKNLKYLGRLRLKDIHRLQDVVATKNEVNDSLDNLVYELPSLLNRTQSVFRPIVKTDEETVNDLTVSDKSFIRFGDGEIMIMEGSGIIYQKYNEILSQRLKDVIKSNHSKLMIGINYYYYYADLSNFLDFPKTFYRTSENHLRMRQNKYLIPEKEYYSASITQVYHTYKNYDCISFYMKMREIWKQKKITIICGNKTFEGIQYNIFDCAKSVDYIYGPWCNAFDRYEELLNKARQIDREKLIIIILGPTAKVLAYDLFLLGYRVLDLGHIAKDFDLVMKNTRKLDTFWLD